MMAMANIELPKDAEGREIPLDTKVLYNNMGVGYEVKRERPGLVRQRLPVLGLRLQGRGRGALPRERRLELLPAVREEGAAWLTR